MDKAFESSAFLQQLYQQHGFSAPADDSAVEQQLQQYLDVFNDIIDDPITHIIATKQRFVLLWSWVHYYQIIDLTKLGNWQTRLAESTVDYALRCAWQLPIFKTALSQDYPDGRVPGLFVLGMGKLGGCDLNFSSDIDLVAFYDSETFPIRATQGKNDIANRVLQQVNKWLSYQNGANVWRIDWRLRPEAGSSALTMSTSAAESFYFYRAPTWHRLALLKAQTIAGDKKQGQKFLNSLESYLWRKNLDYSVIDELHHLKMRINLEHPGLKTQRQQLSQRHQQITQGEPHFNLKLGHGGIREIEFIANGLQLLFGGRTPQLRTTNTRRALSALNNAGLLDDTQVSHLSDAYNFLRRSENALQMLNDQQTHNLPVEEQQQLQLIALLGYSSWQQFSQELFEHRNYVSDQFKQLFSSHESDQNSEQSIDDIIPQWVESLSGNNQNRVSNWHQGFICYGVAPQQAIAISTTILPIIFQCIERYSVDHNHAIQRIDQFFQQLPQGEQYFRLLQKQPALIDTICVALLASPPMASLLEQSPHIVDNLVTGDQLNWSNSLLSIGDTEQRMNALRRQINEQLFYIYQLIINGDIDVSKANNYLTRLAENGLNAGIDIVANEINSQQKPLGILGMGRLGMAMMSPKSDLDIIYIAEQSDDLEYASQFARRLQTVLSAKMREGVVYEIDTRLRPSGRSGTVITSIEMLQRYHFNNALTWEHIALVPSRPATGSKSLQASITNIRQQVLSQPRDRQQCINDFHKMLWRIQEQRIVDGAHPLAIKLRVGGILETDFLVSILVLLHAHKDQGLTEISYAEIIQKLDEHYLYQGLYKIWQLWNSLVIWGRLLDIESKTIDQLTPFAINSILDIYKMPSLDDLIVTIDKAGQQIRQWTDEVIAESTLKDAEALSQWHEVPVIFK